MQSGSFTACSYKTCLAWSRIGRLAGLQVLAAHPLIKRSACKTSNKMPSIDPVSSSSANAAAQYQDYIQRLKAATKSTGDLDPQKTAEAEKLNPASDPDNDGD